MTRKRKTGLTKRGARPDPDPGILPPPRRGSVSGWTIVHVRDWLPRSDSKKAVAVIFESQDARLNNEVFTAIGSLTFAERNWIYAVKFKNSEILAAFELDRLQIPTPVIDLPKRGTMNGWAVLHISDVKRDEGKVIGVSLEARDARLNRQFYEPAPGLSEALSLAEQFSVFALKFKNGNIVQAIELENGLPTQ